MAANQYDEAEYYIPQEENNNSSQQENNTAPATNNYNCFVRIKMKKR